METKRKFLIAILILAIFIFGSIFIKNIVKKKAAVQNNIISNQISMKITSPAFQNNETIPKRYTCDGENINPPIYFEDLPQGTKSLVLIVDDPDAPRGNFLHWLVFNIPPETKLIEENSIPQEAKLGKNDFGKTSYGGPCPPYGQHRYYFKLYALDTVLDLENGATLNEVKSAMRNHILAEAELLGLYQR